MAGHPSAIVRVSKLCVSVHARLGMSGEREDELTRASY